MRQFFTLILMFLLLVGCGNKIDLPHETKGNVVPYKNYFVYAEWEGFGAVTDILVTNAQAVYMAEDSSTVFRYFAKGKNVGGKIVAVVQDSITGFEKPFKLDEGAFDHIWVLDLTDDYPFEKPLGERERAEALEDTLHGLYLSQDGTFPIRNETGKSSVVGIFDLRSNVIALTWTDTTLSVIDTTWRQPGRDSANIRSEVREIQLTSIAADQDDQVYLSGTSLAYSAWGVIEYDTNYVAGQSYGGEFTGLDHIGYQVTYRDSVLQWFVRTYDFFGNFLRESVSDGAGIGFGKEILDVAIAGENLVFVDRSKNEVKINDPKGESMGIESLTGEEATDVGENIPFLLDPGAVAGDPSGSIYIADSGNNRVLKYDDDLFYSTRVDQNKPGVAAEPTVIGVTDSLVYVFDQTDNRVILFEFPKSEE